MFKFNFETRNENDFIENEPSESSKNIRENPEHKWIQTKEIIPGQENEQLVMDIFKNCEILSEDIKTLNLKYFSSIDILNILRTTDDDDSIKNFALMNADQNHSDLQTAIYEGGLKIWECTFDLIHFIVDKELNLKSKNVLDLGCGTGLIGILCLLKESCCTFQDYNSEVLQYITLSNIKLNNEASLKNCKFYSGDWDSFISLLEFEKEDDKFDFIFTSETIYNTDNYGKLHSVFEKHLKRSGEIYLAAKSYYFGVGGGITLFEDYIKSKKVFRSVSCWTCSSGVKREILKITFI